MWSTRRERDASETRKYIVKSVLTVTMNSLSQRRRFGRVQASLDRRPSSGDLARDFASALFRSISSRSSLQRQESANKLPQGCALLTCRDIVGWEAFTVLSHRTRGHLVEDYTVAHTREYLKLRASSTTLVYLDTKREERKMGRNGSNVPVLSSLNHEVKVTVTLKWWSQVSLCIIILFLC